MRKPKFQMGTPDCPIEKYTKLKGGIFDLHNAHLTVYATLEGSKEVVNALGTAEDSVIEIHVMRREDHEGY